MTNLISKIKIIPHTYRDSVVLMEISRELLGQRGVANAAVMMGTPANIAALRGGKLFSTEFEKVRSDDLIVAVEAESTQVADGALELLDKLLNPSSKSFFKELDDGTKAVDSVQEHYSAWKHIPDSGQLAVISVPGPYAVAEAKQALKARRHVLIFSNHISLKDEYELKMEGLDRGLLVLGAECGTAILNGTPLAFANIIRRGNIGIVAASGSGLQEVTCLIDKYGGGISHAIGTGGRDLSSEVGGIAMKNGIDLLLNDESTAVIALLSKPASFKIEQQILSHISTAHKPIVVCFLGASNTNVPPNVQTATTLEDLALKALTLAGTSTPRLEENLTATKQKYVKSSKVLRGLFAGGTLAYESMLILTDLIGPIYSNAPLKPELTCHDDFNLPEHICLDLGSEEYTESRPHPMIDGKARADLLEEICMNPSVRVVLFDVILGIGSDRNPAGHIADKIALVNRSRSSTENEINFVCSIIGTQRDIQGFENQKRILEEVGVTVKASNAEATRHAAGLMISD